MSAMIAESVSCYMEFQNRDCRKDFLFCSKFLYAGPRNRPFDIFSVEWHIICHLTDFPICRTINMDHSDNHEKNKCILSLLKK